MGGLEFERLRDIRILVGVSFSSFEAGLTGREVLAVEYRSKSSVSVIPTRTPPPMTRQGTGK